MAGEQTPNGNSETAATDAEAIAPSPKKQRVARGKKVAAVAAANSSPSKVAKVSNGRRKRTGSGGEVTPALAGETAIAKRRKNGAAVNQTAAAAPASVTNELADLLQLEEENRRLRKTLADKLRAENADLRKKLGLD